MKPRENPFSSDRIDALDYRLSVEDWTSLLKQLSSQGYRGAIIGPHGTGKTTLLDNLGLILEEKGFEVVKETFAPRNRPLHGELMSNLLSNSRAGVILCVDGAEQLSAWQRLRLRFGARKASGLIITAHTKTFLPTLFKCRPTLDTVEEIVEELVGEKVSALRPQIEKLYEKSDGNVRTVLRNLYDEYAKDEQLKH